MWLLHGGENKDVLWRTLTTIGTVGRDIPIDFPVDYSFPSTLLFLLAPANGSTVSNFPV